jgi:hypothetical protein
MDKRVFLCNFIKIKIEIWIDDRLVNLLPTAMAGFWHKNGFWGNFGMDTFLVYFLGKWILLLGLAGIYFRTEA